MSPRDSNVASPSKSSGQSRHSSAGSNLSSPAIPPVADVSKLQTEAPNYFEQHEEASRAKRSLTRYDRDRAKKGSTSPADMASGEINSLDTMLDRPILASKDPSQQTHQERSSEAHIGHGDGTPSTLRTEVKANLDAVRTSGQMSKRKNLLHSNGADFSSTFQTLQPTTSHRHQRTSSADQMIAPPSEKLLRLIIDAAPIQMILSEPVTGKLKWFNNRFFVYHGGLSEKQLVEDPHRSTHPKDKPGYLEAWRKSLATGQQFQHKVRLLRGFDKKYLWFFMRAVPLRDRYQNIVHWLGTAIDINDHHLSEVAFAKQRSKADANARYRALADSCPQITFTATRNDGITLCNSQWLLYSGQSEEQALKIGFLSHVHSEDLQKCRLPHTDGTDGRASDVPVSVGFKQRRKLNRSSSGGTTETSGDDEGKAIPTPPELTQTKLAQLADTGILQVKRNELGRVEYNTEVRLRNRDGAYRWHMVKVVLADSKASIDAGERTWFGSCSDIHDHKELAAQLKNAMEAKSKFLSNMSHEMRTPLNGISGNISLMSGTTLTEEQADFLNAVRSSAEGLQQLVNDVLDFSKAEAGMMKLQLEKFHMRSMIEDVNDTTAVKAMEKGLELNFIVEDKVPVTVIGDKGRLRQVLWNVVNNALKFTSHGEVLVHCEVVEDDHPPSPMKFDKDGNQLGTDENTMIQFTVSDTGPGFSEEDKRKLFHRFSQIDGSSTRQYGGTGLGLVISKALVELHGGTMTAEGSPGKGAQFMFSIKVGHVGSGDSATLTPNTWRGEVSNLDVIKSQMSPTPQRNSGHSLYSGAVFDSPEPYEQTKERPGDTSSSSGRGSGASHSTALLSSAASSIDQTTAYRQIMSTGSTSDVPAGQLPIVITEKSDPTMLCNILIASPLPWTMRATKHHARSVVPAGSPIMVTEERVFTQARSILLDGKLVFSHAILYHDNTHELAAVMQEIFSAPHLAKASIIVVCDPSQKRAIVDQMWSKDFQRMIESRRVGLILKPLKPSKLAPFFDPSHSREMSFDHNLRSASQTVLDQKALQARVKAEWAGRGVRVLIVEDNEVNINVIRAFLKKCSINAEIAHDGNECTDMVFKHEPAYYSIVLCDLQMPHKDGW